MTLHAYCLPLPLVSQGPESKHIISFVAVSPMHRTVPRTWPVVGAPSMIVEIICKFYRINSRSFTRFVTSSKRVVLNSSCLLGSPEDFFNKRKSI